MLQKKLQKYRKIVTKNKTHNNKTKSVLPL